MVRCEYRAMTDRSVMLDQKLGGTIHRRSFAKDDGRMLHLYGRSPHTHAPLPQQTDELAKGAQWRFHPLRGEWNVYAAHRQNRTFKPAAHADPLAPSRPGAPATEIPFTDFEIAVFDNKFAAFHPDAPMPPPMPGLGIEPARGACEVIVYTPEPEGSLHTIGQDRRQLLIATWIDRIQALFNAGCDSVMPFENRGPEVGATLHHPHGQIYGFDRIPAVQSKAVAAFANGYDLAAEIVRSFGDGGSADYGVTRMNGMAAFCPRFARFPYEIWIAPEARRAQLWDCSADELNGFAHLLGEATRRYDAFFGRATPYMFALHCAPREGARGYHWTAQFYPILRDRERVKYLASVEQHSGVFTVDVLPEDAAKTLRDVG